MLQTAIDAARDAGKYIRENVSRYNKVSFKTSDKDLVTEIDKNAEKIIRKHIHKSFPEHSILGEESVDAGSEAAIRALRAKKNDQYLWIIDPVDGTTNFVHGFPFFCVSIAMAEKGKVKLGVIYAPMMDELFVTEKEKGANLNGHPISVSKERNLAESLLSTNLPKTEGGMESLMAIRPAVRNIRTPGSAALQLANVAAGRLSGYWEEDLNAWDIAAGALLVEEAGGSVSDISGKTYDLSVRDILATNKRIHEPVIKAINHNNQ